MHAAWIIYHTQTQLTRDDDTHKSRSVNNSSNKMLGFAIGAHRFSGQKETVGTRASARATQKDQKTKKSGKKWPRKNDLPS